MNAFKLSLETKGTIKEVHQMLKAISHKLQILNKCSQSLVSYHDVKEDTLYINRDIVVLWLKIIMVFRDPESGLCIISDLRERHDLTRG